MTVRFLQICWFIYIFSQHAILPIGELIFLEALCLNNFTDAYDQATIIGAAGQYFDVSNSAQDMAMTSFWATFTTTQYSIGLWANRATYPDGNLYYLFRLSNDPL